MGMHLKSLRVAELRQFRQSFELADLAPGLNIISGPNEAGKSTLVRAIRAAFLERYASTSVRDLQPWEDSTAAPTVELQFDLGGKAHRLSKTFLLRRRCTLHIDQTMIEGDAAEAYLANSFGFAIPVRGPSRPELWGIPGLLWVEQGTGQELQLDYARNYLHNALQGLAQGAGDAAAGALAATGGDMLLKKLRVQRDELLTARTGQPTGDLATALKNVQEVQSELAELDQSIGLYQQQVDELATLRQQRQADEAAKPWDELGRQLDQAREAEKDVAACRQQLGDDHKRQAQLQQTLELLDKELATLAGKRDVLLARQHALTGETEAKQLADQMVAAARQRADEANAAALAAAEGLRLARQEATRTGLLQDLPLLQAEADRDAQTLQRAEQAEQDLAALRKRVTAVLPITQDQVEQLRGLERKAREAGLLRQAVATRLQFSLPAGQSVTMATAGAEHELQSSGERLLDMPATLRLPGGGELVITPGGRDLAELVRAHADAQDRLHAALQSAGLADLAEADARLEAHLDGQSQLAMAANALAIVAPQGLEPLRAAVAQSGGRLQAAQETLARLPAEPTQLIPSQAQAEAQEATATQDDKAAQQTLAQAMLAQAEANGRRDAAVREHAAAEAALADPEHEHRQQRAQQQFLVARNEQDALGGRIRQLATQLEEARPDILAQDIQRLERSREQRLADHRQLRDQILVLDNTLQSADAQNLDERRAQAQAARDRAVHRHGQLKRRAAALDLLCGKLDAKRQATVARLQAPLQQRLQHYLPLLLRGASMQVSDATLAPDKLTRASAAGQPQTGAVADLSFGAREQLGVISRFAYADLLKQAGRPTLLILDDALVHSDAQRLAQMKRVLFDATQRHQVLLFTCHPEAWRDMAVTLRQLPAR